MSKKNSIANLESIFKETVTVVGGQDREVRSLIQITHRTLPNWEQVFCEQTLRATQVFREIVALKPSPYDGPTNRRKIWKQFLFAVLGIDIPLWQFVCPPKITLDKSGWRVENNTKYDILEGSIETTRKILGILSTAGIKYDFNLFYPDDEIVKARASGLKLKNLPKSQQKQLRYELEEISLEQCIKIQDRVQNLAQVRLWTDATVSLKVNLDEMFEQELLFWRQRGEKAIGFFRETQSWLVKTFRFDQQLSFELTARRFAKYAVEGRMIARMFPFGSIYLNNEFPFNEPWAMYTASVTPEERNTMAVLFYL